MQYLINQTLMRQATQNCRCKSMVTTTQEDRTRFFVILLGISTRPAELVNPLDRHYPELAMNCALCKQGLIYHMLCRHM